MPTATRRSLLPPQAPSSEHSRRKGKRRRGRRSIKAGEETSVEATGTRISEDEAKETTTTKREDEEVVSSAPSSPIYDDPDPSSELIKAWERAQRNADIEKDRHEDLVTIEYCRPSHMFFNPELLPVAEPATQAVLSAARFVIGLSSSFGQQVRKRCSGFWIDWNEENKTGIALTTAHLISSKGCSIEQKGDGVEGEYAPNGEVKYYPHAKVSVHLPDGSATVGHLIYYQEHYDLAFFRVSLDQLVQKPSFNDGVKSAQLVFWLGRDANSNLTMTHLRPGYKNPSTYQRPHYMFYPGKQHIIKYDNGGPIIDLDAKVVGMISSHRSGYFIPSSVLLKCLDLWKELECIPRPQLGLAFSGIKLLDLVQAEKIWRKYKIDDGLIVNKVLKGSQAEEVGIRSGDIIECFNGERISTTVQLENLLLSLCKSAGNGCDSKIHVSVQVFHVRKLRRKIREFIVGVSEHLEIIERAYKPVTLEEGTSTALVST